MIRKRDTKPETVLQNIIALLETEYDRNHRAALLALLSQGPLVCRPDRLLQEIEAGEAETVLSVRATLLQFLRTLVRVEGWDSTQAEIGTDGHFVFTGQLARGRVEIAVGGGNPRDVVVLQLIALLQAVGLRNVRRCSAVDCPHLFVKVYRRVFCSTRCQKRDHAQRTRQQPARQRQARRRRARGGQ